MNRSVGSTGNREVVFAPAVLLVTFAVVVGIVLVALLAGPEATLAAEPSLEPVATTGVLGPGDPRSEGQGPGIVGSPLVILAGVIVLGVATAVLTAVVARVWQRD